MTRLPVPASAAVMAVLAAVAFGTSPSSAEPPNLILQITVDQLRGDMLHRFKGRFGPKGFRHLMDQGVVYSNAHYRHSTTFTAVGHATLYTGGYAAQHGFAGNDWYDQETGQRVYCVEDDRHTIIGKEPKAHQGTSPRNLTSTTIGDELVLATGGKARVFGVSIKDRGAIIPAGRLGKAFWYSKGSGAFVSSTYYYDDYPDWVKAWNAAKPADRYKDHSWTLLQDSSSYVFAEADDRPEERSYKKLGRTFPHALGNEKAKDYYAGLRFSPMGDELTLDFVKELVTQEKVGQKEATDFLSVSFSATDYIGHAFGPSSLEAEDNLLRLDGTLADLFQFIDEKVGLERTLVVLSSDHGIDEIPEYKSALGFDAGRHYPKKFVEQVDTALQARFKSEQKLVAAFWNPSLYLNVEPVRMLGYDLATVEQALAEEIVKVTGIALAVTRSNLLSGNITDTPILQKVQRAFHPKRSGNVLIVQDQFWYLYPKPEAFAAMHGSPYSYDTFVPIMFAGPGIESQEVRRPVGPDDIAATIAAYLGIKPPSGSVGTALFEALPGAGEQGRAAAVQ